MSGPKKHLSEPWFSLVATGAKTFEGRLGNNAELAAVPIGGTISWYNDDLGFRRTAVTRVTSKSTYKSFRTMLAAKGVGSALPTVDSVDKGVAVYEKFYPPNVQLKHGVLCIGVRVVPP